MLAGGTVNNEILKRIYFQVRMSEGASSTINNESKNMGHPMPEKLVSSVSL